MWRRESGTLSFPTPPPFLSCRVSIHMQDHPIHPHLGDYTIFFPCHSPLYLQLRTSVPGLQQPLLFTLSLIPADALNCYLELVNQTHCKLDNLNKHFLAFIGTNANAIKTCAFWYWTEMNYSILPGCFIIGLQVNLGGLKDTQTKPKQYPVAVFAFLLVKTVWQPFQCVSDYSDEALRLN